MICKHGVFCFLLRLEVRIVNIEAKPLLFFSEKDFMITENAMKEVSYCPFASPEVCILLIELTV